MPPEELITQPNITDPDGFYDSLVRLYEGLEEEESHALNARLILVLCNHIGDRHVLSEAFRIAKDSAHDPDHPAGSRS